jgi:hypothetical protein
MIRILPATPRRVVGALGLLACVVTFSAACTSSATPAPVPTAVGGSGAGASASVSTGANAAGGGVTNPATAASTAAAGSGGSGGGSGSGGSSPAASPKAVSAGTCLVRYLNGSTGLSQGAAGSTYVNIVFKNLNTTPCTLNGYPGVSLGAGTPVNQVGQPAGRDSVIAAKVITLQPGGYAYATLRVTDALNYPASTCKPAATAWLLVYPPNTSNLLYIPYKTNACTGNVVTLSVQAVQAGNGG